MRCCRLYWLLTLASRSTSFRLRFSLSRATSAACDVLANFLRLSIFISLVNIFFCFTELYLSPAKLKRSDNHSHSAKYQNIVTPESKNKRRALSSWYFFKSTAVAWVWIAGRPLGSQPRSNAWTALRHPLLHALIIQEPRCEAVLLYFSLRVSCFSFPCKLLCFPLRFLPYASLRLPEIIKDSTSAQPQTC